MKTVQVFDGSGTKPLGMSFNTLHLTAKEYKYEPHGTTSYGALKLRGVSHASKQNVETIRNDSAFKRMFNRITVNDEEVVRCMRIHSVASGVRGWDYKLYIEEYDEH